MSPDFRTTARYLKSAVRSRARTVAADDGTALSVEEWGPRRAPPVLLSHEFAVDTRMNWYVPGIVDRLAKAGLHVVGVDLRGHGRSGKPHDPDGYGPVRMGADIVAVLDALSAERAALVGYGMGAIASVAAALADARVDALVLGGLGAFFARTGTADIGDVTTDRIAEALETDDPELASAPDVAGYRMAAELLKGDRFALAAAARAVDAGPFPLDRIRARTLVVSGADDPMATDPDVLAAAIPGARAVTVPGDHLGVVSEAGFADAIAGFLTTDGADPLAKSPRGL